MLRHALSVALLATGTAFAAVAAADCTYPRQPTSLPNGETATREEMIAGQQSVRTYLAEMDTYLKCLESEVPKAEDVESMSDEQKQERERLETMRVQKHNAAVTEMEQVAERFNVQLRAFRERDQR